MVDLLLLFALPLVMMLIIFLRQNTKAIQNPPPGPKGLPFIGNLHQFDAKAPHLHLCRLSKKYGPLMSLKLGSVPTLVISSAELAKLVLKTHDDIFASRPSRVGLQKLSYNGLDIAFSPLNDYQREMKRICVLHLLSTKHVQSFRPISEQEVSKMIAKISKQASLGEVINLKEIVMFFSSNFISRVAVGKSYDDVEGSEKRRFDELQNEAQASLGGFYFADYFPSLGWIDRFTGAISGLEKIFKEMDSFFQELIEEHLNRPESTKQQDILDILLKLKQERSSSYVELTFDHIKAVLMNIFVAGTDTGTAAIIWAMTALMKAPEAMKRVQTEIRDFVEGKGLVEEENIQNLPYLKAVIKETLRLYPSGPLLVPRETTESCNLDGYEIRPKTLVFVNAWAIGRDPQFWGNNSHEFLPERFLDSTMDYRGQDSGFIPFGSGRRICPGISMGVAIVEAVIANLLYSFDWELPPGMEKQGIDMDSLPGLVMHKKTPLCLVAKSHAH